MRTHGSLGNPSIYRRGPEEGLAKGQKERGRKQKKQRTWGSQAVRILRMCPPLICVTTASRVRL